MTETVSPSALKSASAPQPVHVVMSNEVARQTLVQVLEQAGHVVAQHGAARLFLAEKIIPGPACVIADMRTPGMDGLQLQEQIVARNLDLRLILLTNAEDVPLAIRALRAGAHDFLDKPYDATKLLESVTRALKGEGQPSDADKQATQRAIAKLTAREKDVLDLLILGCADHIIARRLTIEPPTVQIHRGRIMEKMKPRDLADLIRNVLAVTKR